MTKKESLRLASPLTPPEGLAGQSLWATQAVLSFMVSVVLILAIALGARAEQWMGAMQGHLVFEVPSSTSASELRDFVQALNKTKGVSRVESLSRTRLIETLQNWIHTVRDLPLPQLVQVEMTRDARVRDIIAAATREIPTVLVHEGQETFAQGMRQIMLLGMAAQGLIALMIVVVAAMGFATALWRLESQRAIVDLLHALGASRAYVVRSLAGGAFWHSLTSAALGCGVALIVAGMLWIFGFGTQAGEVSVVGFWPMACALLVPLAMAVITALSAAVAVRRTYTAYRGQDDSA